MRLHTISSEENHMANHHKIMLDATTAASIQKYLSRIVKSLHDLCLVSLMAASGLSQAQMSTPGQFGVSPSGAAT